MGCNAEYMQANALEKELSKVACFIDEVNGIQWSQSSYQGYHPDIYCKNKSKSDADYLVSKLCELLQGKDVSSYSLELQMWWRDHQLADKERLENELKKHEYEHVRKLAISKLTDYERKILGLE